MVSGDATSHFIISHLNFKNIKQLIYLIIIDASFLEPENCNSCLIVWSLHCIGSAYVPHYRGWNESYVWLTEGAVEEAIESLKMSSG